jgi:hypothetical protein
MRFLRTLESLVRMLQRLFGKPVSALVILFAVVRGRGTVRVGGQFVQFGGSLMRVIWHSFPNRDVPRILEPFHFSSCPILNTRAAATRFSSGVQSARTTVEVKTNGIITTGEKGKERLIVSPSLRW